MLSVHGSHIMAVMSGMCYTEVNLAAYREGLSKGPQGEGPQDLPWVNQGPPVGDPGTSCGCHNNVEKMSTPYCGAIALWTKCHFTYSDAMTTWKRCHFHTVVPYSFVEKMSLYIL